MRTRTWTQLNVEKLEFRKKDDRISTELHFRWRKKTYERVKLEKFTNWKRRKKMLDLSILSQKIISDCIIAGEKVDFWFNRFIYKNDPLN